MSRSWKNEFHRWRDKCKNIEECTLDIEECRGDSKFSFHPLVDTLNICKSWHDLTEGGKRKTYYANGYIIFFLNDYSTCKHIITVTYIPSLLFNLSYKILSKCKEFTFILLLSINPHPTHPTPPFLFSRPRTHYLTSHSLNCLSLSLSSLHILLTKINQHTPHGKFTRLRFTNTHIWIQCMLRCIGGVISIGETNFKWWGGITHEERTAWHEGDAVWIGMGEFV